MDGNTQPASVTFPVVLRIPSKPPPWRHVPPEIWDRSVVIPWTRLAEVKLFTVDRNRISDKCLVIFPGSLLDTSQGSGGQPRSEAIGR